MLVLLYGLILLLHFLFKRHGFLPTALKGLVFHFYVFFQFNYNNLSNNSVKQDIIFFKFFLFFYFRPHDTPQIIGIIFLNLWFIFTYTFLFVMNFNKLCRRGWKTCNTKTKGMKGWHLPGGQISWNKSNDILNLSVVFSSTMTKNLIYIPVLFLAIYVHTYILAKWLNVVCFLYVIGKTNKKSLTCLLTLEIFFSFLFCFWQKCNF